MGVDKLPSGCEFEKERIFSEGVLVFENMRLLFDYFQLWFSGSTARFLNLFTKKQAMELLFHGPKALHREQILHSSFAYLILFVNK